jgi:hypothetical protein
LETGDPLSPLLFDFVSKYDFRKEESGELELNGKY